MSRVHVVLGVASVFFLPAGLSMRGEEPSPRAKAVAPAKAIPPAVAPPVDALVVAAVDESVEQDLLAFALADPNPASRAAAVEALDREAALHADTRERLNASLLPAARATPMLPMEPLGEDVTSARSK